MRALPVLFFSPAYEIQEAHYFLSCPAYLFKVSRQFI
jgi:hypothetical protein